MAFRQARFEERQRTYSNPGSPVKTEYLRKYDKDGKGYLVENGKTNIYEKIQADAESRNINNIIARVVRGDTSMLNYNDIYGDFINTPTNMMDAMNLQIRAEAMWNSLPVEIRQHYNNDKMQYIADFGSETFMKLHGYAPTTKDIVDDIVAKEESKDA